MVLKFSEYTKNVSNIGGKTEQLSRWFNDHEVWLTVLDDRIRALEPQAAPVDPIYAEIEEWVRTTLGGKDVPEEALRSIIDDVYAKRTK
jgi:hypothetical protein